MSGKKKWLRCYLEQLLAEQWSEPVLVRDGDGDYPFRYGTAMAWVTLPPADPTTVSVFAHAVIGVKRSGRLFAELNDIQSGHMGVTLVHSDGCVLVSQTISAHGLNRQTLHRALASVSEVADEIGPFLASMFGGETPYPAEESVDEGAA
jgi:hypothetical protein